MNRIVSTGAVALALSLAACSSMEPKSDPGDELADGQNQIIDDADAKADLPAGAIRLLGSLSYGESSRSVSYTGKTLAYKFAGQVGDKVTIHVASTDGDAVAFLYNDDRPSKRLAWNDDTSRSDTNSTVTFTLTANASATSHTYYILFRDYYYDNAHFTVTLDGVPALDPIYGCHADADCTAISAGGCCPNGRKAAVNKGGVAAYNATVKCANPRPICPLYLILERRIPQCNTGTQKCEMVEPQGSSCGGFTRNPHACAPGYNCVQHRPNIPDIPGTCEQSCGGFAGRTCDTIDATCVDDPGDSCDPAHGGADCGGVCEVPTR
jgi:hypothetical protein